MIRKLKTDGRGLCIEEREPVQRKAATPYVYPQWMIDMWQERDRVIYADPKTCDETKQAILERYNKI